MWLNFIVLPSWLLYINCFLIILVVLFSSEKSVIDIFSEQYGNNTTPKSEMFLNLFIFLLVFLFFYTSFYHCIDQLKK
ncbi:MAG: hypothetical protein Q8888_00770 [Vigna little leaf phytoplasma]|nr:hypothetical protein [Vigna little leaf phytoplasma]MDV3198182.1 hypothetical protein [Vigna little leaf phytoplasma]